MKIALLKLSGKALDNLFVNQEWLKTINGIKEAYHGLVIVHGAGVKISEWSWALGYEPKFIHGQRVTDESTMEVVAAVQSGLLNGKLVSKLQTSGINAIGLTGIDNGLFKAEYFDEKLGFVGNPVQTGETGWLLNLISANIVPVFSSMCRDKNGNLMNINADVFAKELAVTLNADTVFFLSDVNGVKLNGTLQNVLIEEEILDGISSGQITDGMIPKLQSCLSLIKSGIHKVWIGSDLLNINFNEHLFESNLKGTWIVESKAIAV